MHTIVLLLGVWCCVSHHAYVSIKSMIQEIFSAYDAFVSPSAPSCDCPYDLYASGVRNCVCVPFSRCDEAAKKFENDVTDERVKEKPICPSSQRCCGTDNVTNPRTHGFEERPSADEGFRTEETGISSIPLPPVDDSCDCPKDLSASGARNCVCVLHYLCNSKKEVDRSGKNIVDPRYAGPDEKTSCASQHHCCSLDNVTKTPTTAPENFKPPPCGWRKPDGVHFRSFSRIIGFSEAEFGEFPWMVAILYAEEDLRRPQLHSYHCGGTLIHPKAVISAAHCFNNAKRKFIVRAGEWDLRVTTETYPSQDRKIKEIITHPDFNTTTLYNDIAFLLLESSINLSTPHIGLACLPQQGTTFPTSTDCFATGWGKNTYGSTGRHEFILKKIDLRIVGRTSCQRMLSTAFKENFKLDRSFICAGGTRDKDTCKGDSGSPLVCPIHGSRRRYQQTGIVSWGVGWGFSGVPGVLTDVALFRDWIDHHAITNNLDTSTYTY